jgi:DNA-binding response OmpR family regulator
VTQNGPRILVVNDEWDERMMIASVLREAGFEVVATTQDGGVSTATSGGSFAAAVIALPDDDGVEFLRRARRRQPGLKALLVVEPAALRLAEEDCATLVKRPFDPRELLGCVFAVVLREDEQQAAPTHCHVAEFGIAAARLACLHNRRDAAAAVGAHHLALELTRQISESTAARSGPRAAAT